MKRFLIKTLCWFLFLSYITGAFLTAAYCTVHRWDDWQEQRDEHPSNAEPGLRALAASVAWPVYWTFKGSVKLVETVPNITFSIEQENPKSDD